MLRQENLLQNQFLPPESPDGIRFLLIDPEFTRQYLTNGTKIIKIEQLIPKL